MAMWSAIFGQEKVKKSLTRLFQSEALYHGLIFFGGDGVGKDAVAIRLATLLTKDGAQNDNFTENGNIKFITALPRGKNENDSDGPLDKIPFAEFENIRDELQAKGINPYHKITIPNANDIKINSIRDIQKFLSFSSETSQKRVIIISGAENMNETAQNALLKNLEEPPDNTYFILTTNNLTLIRETIISRCQTIQFSPLMEDEIEEILQKYFNRNKDEAYIVSKIAEGSYTKALELLNFDIKYFLEKTIAILRYGLAGKHYSCLKEINEIAKNADKEFLYVIEFIIYWLYELNSSRNSKIPYYYADYQNTIQKFNLKYGQISLTDTINNFEYLLFQVKNTNLNINVIKFRIVMLLSSII